MNTQTPAQIFQDLFIAMHESGLWEDGKSISDVLPKGDPEEILAAYHSAKAEKGFDLATFVESHFDFPESPSSGFETDTSQSVEAHIERLWEVLTRQDQMEEKTFSRINLPNRYVVPGGRFNEVYYWDSYFTMLGLRESGKDNLISGMIENFAFLIENYGLIPNGNRTYFLGRSQPPFFSSMIQLACECDFQNRLDFYLSKFDLLQKEYEFWMNSERAVELDGDILNRYWDAFDEPRAEMYQDDIELQQQSGREASQLFRDLRCACESGWDFSSRWLRNPNDLGTIHASEILPVDLNCLVWHQEMTLANMDAFSSTPSTHDYSAKAEKRKALIIKYFWSDTHQFFMDYDFAKAKHKEVISAAGMYPLFFGLASDKQAVACAKILKQHLLKPGGIVCTPHYSDQQWDAPNGWAPLQWIAIKGLKNYGFDDLAHDIANRWLSLNEKVFKSTGKMLEKYNVIDTDLETGGGEYLVQDGFGWTNGVYLALKKLVNK